MCPAQRNERDWGTELSCRAGPPHRAAHSTSHAAWRYSMYVAGTLLTASNVTTTVYDITQRTAHNKDFILLYVV